MTCNHEFEGTGYSLYPEKGLLICKLCHKTPAETKLEQQLAAAKADLEIVNSAWRKDAEIYDAQLQEACEYLTAFCPPNYAVVPCNNPTKGICTECWVKFISTPKGERGTNAPP